MADAPELGNETKQFIKLSPEVRHALEVLKDRMACGRPRTLRITTTERPFLLFTDGAYEPNNTCEKSGLGPATIGGVLFDSDGRTHVFGCNVDDDVLKDWLEIFEHPIGLIELYAIAVSFRLWGHLFSMLETFNFW